MNDIDTGKMREAVKHFAFYSTPSSANSQTGCTVGDIRKVIDQAAKMMYAIINEIENAQSQ